MVDRITIGAVVVGGRKVRGGRMIATRCVMLLGGIVTWGQRRGYVAEGMNPAHGIEMPQSPPRDRILSDDELARLGRTMRGKRGATVLELILLTGLRRNEAAALKWSEVDAEGHCLRLAQTKTGKSVRPIGAAALDLLRELPRDGEHVFPAPQRANYFDVRYCIPILLKAAGGLRRPKDQIDRDEFAREIIRAVIKYRLFDAIDDFKPTVEKEENMDKVSKTADLLLTLTTEATALGTPLAHLPVTVLAGSDIKDVDVRDDSTTNLDHVRLPVLLPIKEGKDWVVGLRDMARGMAREMARDRKRKMERDKIAENAVDEINAVTLLMGEWLPSVYYNHIRDFARGGPGPRFVLKAMEIFGIKRQFGGPYSTSAVGLAWETRGKPYSKAWRLQQPNVVV
jgi:hypothetical protein